MSAARLVSTEALLLKKVVHRESDAFLVLFTKDLGKIAAGARGAQRSQKRFGGALEPVHTLSIELSLSRTDHYDLRSASVERPRLHLTQSLALLQAAGRALGWLRQGAMERDPEPLVWSIMTRLLDQLDTPASNGNTAAEGVTVHLAEAGLALLNAWGWALQLENCCRCGRPCPSGKTAYLDAAAGGVICSACGGARTRVEGGVRMRLLAASQGEAGVLTPDDASLALSMTETALRTHADID